MQHRNINDDEHIELKKATKKNFLLDWQTYHLFLVLLEVGVDEEAPCGVAKSVLNIVDALVPAWGKRGSSCGHLGEWKSEIYKQTSILPQKFVVLISLFGSKDLMFKPNPLNP